MAPICVALCSRMPTYMSRSIRSPSSGVMSVGRTGGGASAGRPTIGMCTDSTGPGNSLRSTSPRRS